MSIDYSLLIIWLHPWDSFIIDFEKLQAQKLLMNEGTKNLGYAYYVFLYHNCDIYFVNILQWEF